MKAKMISCPCGGKIRKGEDYATFLVEGRKVKKLMPALICDKCGEVYFDGPLIAQTGKKLRREAVVV